jgi:cell division protein FtsL
VTRRVVLLLVIAIPVLLFANALQAYRYSQLEREVGRLQDRQVALIEENKRAILALSVLSSPQRIGPLAENELGLVRVDGAEIVRMQAGAAEGDR